MVTLSKRLRVKCLYATRTMPTLFVHTGNGKLFADQHRDSQDQAGDYRVQQVVATSDWSIFLHSTALGKPQCMCEAIGLAYKSLSLE